MNHYQVLGVATTATTAEIRRSYLKLARVHHPDFRPTEQGASATRQSSSEERMRDINLAWHVLGDAARRSEYDSKIGVTSARAKEEPSGVRINRPTSDFTPLDDSVVDDSWRYEPDHGDPATVPPKVLLAAPAVFLAVGLGLLAVSAPTGSRGAVAGGIIALILSALLFVGAPVVALFKSQLTEQQVARRRRRSR